MSSSERNKEMISIMINICTRVVTLVFMIATVFILIFSDDKDIRWSITDIWGVLLIGIVSGAGFGIFYIKKNNKFFDFCFACRIVFTDDS